MFPLSDGQNGLGRTFGCCNEALVVWFLPGLEMQQPGQPALEIAMPGTSTKANQPWISALSSPKSRSYNPKIQQKIIKKTLWNFWLRPPIPNLFTPAPLEAISLMSATKAVQSAAQSAPLFTASLQLEAARLR